jgi:DNA-binding NtrC family response regulator
MKTNNYPMDTSTGNHSHSILVLGNPETACGLIAMALNHREDALFTDNAVEAFNMMEQQSFGVVIAFQKDEIGIGMNFMESVAKVYPDTQRIMVVDPAEILHLISQINDKVVNRVITTNLSPDAARDIIEKSEAEFNEARENGAWIHDLRRQNHQYEFMLRQKLAY